MMPGTMVRWGAVAIRSTPSSIIVPQEGFGGRIPAPRNDSDASSRIALAIRSVKKTRRVDARFGSTSPNMMRSGEPPQGERDAERDAQNDRRERPHHVEQTPDADVHLAAEEPGEQTEDDREHRGHQGRRDPDHERVPPSVQQAHHDVPAVLVRSKEELALPGRADRSAVERDHVRPLAIDHDRVGEVIVARPGVRHVLRPQRRGKAGRYQQDEEEPEEERDLVAPQAPEPELPGADAMNP